MLSPKPGAIVIINKAVFSKKGNYEHLPKDGFDCSGRLTWFRQLRPGAHKLSPPCSRTVKKPTTWSGCHTVSDTVEIQASVTLAPGAVLKFKENAGLKIQQNGSLNASGTPRKPITFTATDKTPGYWFGLYYSSRSSHNRLHFAKILYAGGTKVGRHGTTLRRAGGDPHPPSMAVRVSDNASLSIENTRVMYSGGHGIEVLGQLTSFKHNLFSHTKIPMRAQPDAIDTIDTCSKFRHNGKNRIEMVGNGTIRHDATWQNPDVPYLLEYYNSLAANLEIKPGVHILFGKKSGINVERGSLKVVGTPKKSIVFQGLNKSPGFWNDLQFGSTSSNNILRYVHVVNGGGDQHDQGEVYITNRGALSIEHTRVYSSARPTFL